jgi:hypothetical protein
VDQNNQNPGSRNKKAAAGTDNLSEARADVNSELLFEATEAFIRALSTQNPADGEHAAIVQAIHSEALAPFDGPLVMQAVAFLRRMGYLSPESRKAA